MTGGSLARKLDRLSYLSWLPAGFAPASATAESAATATAATETAFGTGTGFVDVQGAAVELLAVEGFDGFQGLGLIGHFNEGEATGLPGVAIADDAGLFNSAVGGKNRLELRLGGLIRKVSNKNIRH